MHDVGRAVCENCDEKGLCVRTDILNINEGTKQDVCTECYLEPSRVELPEVLLVTFPDDQYLTVFLEDKDQVERLQRELTDILPDDAIGFENHYFKDLFTDDRTDKYGKELFPVHYVLAIATGILPDIPQRYIRRYLHGSRDPEHRYQADSSHIYRETRREIGNQLREAVIDSPHYREIEDTSDIPSVVAEVFPFMTDYQIFFEMCCRSMKRYLKENPEILPPEKRDLSPSAAVVGQRFEQFFEWFCLKNGLDCMQITGNAEASMSKDLKRNAPETYDILFSEFGTVQEMWSSEFEQKTYLRFSINPGLPDFYVRKNKSRDVRRLWEPKQDEAFVEVKHGSATLNDNQQERFPELIEQGYEIWIFRGTEDDYTFEKYTP